MLDRKVDPIPVLLLGLIIEITALGVGICVAALIVAALRKYVGG
jgi:hypothetical protein